MGNWSLEVFKMALYIAFPVALFHIFNQPIYFEKWVTEKKRELYPPENPSHRESMQKVIREMRERQDQEIIKNLEKIEK